MKRMKKIMASILAAAVCVSTCMAYTGNVAKASGEALAASDFKMVGASVRFEDAATVNGIRFGIGIKDSVYTGLSANVKDSIRLLVMPTKLVTGDLEIGETYTKGNVTAYAIDTPIGAEWVKKTYADGDYYVTYVYLENIDNTCYNIDVTVRAYWKANEESAPVYSNTVDRSYIYVAEAALNDVAAEESEAYPNAVGTKFSPYTAAQRDALIDVPYEQTTNTLWDYVDGAFIKKGTWGGDEFIYDRTIDASKDFTAYFTYKMQPNDGLRDNRFLNFGESADGKTYFEFDFSISGSVYKVHCRKQDNGLKFIETGHDFTFIPEETYDFKLVVDYEGTTMTADLQARVHDSYTTYTSVRSAKFSNDFGTMPVGNKFGYCLHAESRGSFFEDANDRYQVNTIDFNGNSKKATGAIVEELPGAIRVSGLTANSGQTALLMLDTRTYDKTVYGSANIHGTISMDIAFEKFNDSSYAGFKFGFYDDVFRGADREIVLYPNKIGGWEHTEHPLSSYMTPDQLTAYQTKIANGEAINFKIVFTSTGGSGDQADGKTTAQYYIDGIDCGTYTFDDQRLWEDRVALITNTNATFSNLVIE